EGKLQACPKWPPDVFAITAQLLVKSGSYARILGQWPPSGFADAENQWDEHATHVGRSWCIASTDVAPSGPDEVAVQWQRIASHADVHISEVRDDAELQEACLRLLAYADEASNGVGFPGTVPVEVDLPSGYKEASKRYLARAHVLLAGPSGSLTEYIDT